MIKTKNKIKKIMSTSVYRILLIVTAVILPINILTLVLSSTTVNEVERQVSEDHR